MNGGFQNPSALRMTVLQDLQLRAVLLVRPPCCIRRNTFDPLPIARDTVVHGKGWAGEAVVNKRIALFRVFLVYRVDYTETGCSEVKRAKLPSRHGNPALGFAFVRCARWRRLNQLPSARCSSVRGEGEQIVQHRGARSGESDDEQRSRDRGGRDVWDPADAITYPKTVDEIADQCLLNDLSTDRSQSCVVIQ